MDRSKEELQFEYHAGTISKQELGKLRRLKLTELLDKIVASENALNLLDSKKSKLDRTKICKLVKYDTKPVNLRQSFKPEIEAAEDLLRQKGIIINQAKTTKQVGDENAKNFLAFLEERLANDSYEWAVNNKNRVYHKKIWSFFLDQPMDEIKSAPAMFSRNFEVKNKLAEIDVMIAKKEIKTLCYASETALDEMQDTMTSAAISKLRQQIKEVKEQLAGEREERKRLETKNHELKNEIEQFKEREKSLFSASISSIKIAGAH